MKVLYLIHYAGSGGAERYVELLLRHFGPGCGLCCGVPGPLSETAQALGNPVHVLPMGSPLDLKAARALAKLCREHGYDIVHAQFPRENCIAILAQRFGCPAKVVYTAHLAEAQPLRWKLLNRLFTPHNHRIIAVCRAGAQALRRNGAAPEKIQIIPNGIDPGVFPQHPQDLTEFGIRKGEPVITTLARFSPEKGLDLLCDAIARLKDRTDLSFRVLMVGDGPELGAIQSQIARLQLEDTVILPGRRSDTARLLASSHIYVNSSRSEAMSFAILEAMAAGLPIVATDTGGNPELIDETCGILVPCADTAAFTDCLKRLLESESLRRQLGEAARNRAQTQFTQKNMLDAVRKLYEH